MTIIQIAQIAATTTTNFRNSVTRIIARTMSCEDDDDDGEQDWNDEDVMRTSESCQFFWQIPCPECRH